MRGKLAKHIRHLVTGNTEHSKLSLVSTYEPDPRTARVKKFATATTVLNDKGERVPVIMELKTATYRLSRECRRYFSQRLKRYLKRYT